jgi:hypothetical protein
MVVPTPMVMAGRMTLMSAILTLIINAGALFLGVKSN